MNLVRRMKIPRSDLEQIQEDLDGYIWVIFDIRKGVMSAGDEYVMTLRDSLLTTQHSQPCDIYGIGLDLETGAYCDLRRVNYLNKTTHPNGRLSEAKIRRIDDLVCYFFQNLPAYDGCESDDYDIRDAFIRSMREL